MVQRHVVYLGEINGFQQLAWRNSVEMFSASDLAAKGKKADQVRYAGVFDESEEFLEVFTKGQSGCFEAHGHALYEARRDVINGAGVNGDVQNELQGANSVVKIRGRDLASVTCRPIQAGRFVDFPNVGLLKRESGLEQCGDAFLPVFFGTEFERGVCLETFPVNGESVAKGDGAAGDGGLALRLLALCFFKIQQTQLGNGGGRWFQRANNELALNAKPCKMLPRRLVANQIGIRRLEPS